MTQWDVFEVALELVRCLREAVAVLARHDGELASQVRRAASSVPLNLAEGRRRVGKDRLHLWRVAAGSADEVRAALRVAGAWGYLGTEALAGPLGLTDRVLAMTYRLTR